MSVDSFPKCIQNFCSVEKKYKMSNTQLSHRRIKFSNSTSEDAKSTVTSISDELSTDSKDKLKQLKIFSGNTHLDLTNKICSYLQIPLGKSVSKKLTNSETSFEVKESIEGCDVYIIQSGSKDVNSSLMELLIMINACKINSAAKITAVIPYFPYMLDKPDESNVPVSAKLISKMLTIAGADAIMTMDILDANVHSMYNIPINNLTGEPIIINWIKENIPEWKDSVLISRDAKRAVNITNSLQIQFALMHRGSENALFLIGNVFERVCIIIDDIADTCQRISLMAEKLKQQGAKKMYAIVIHGTFSGNAYSNIMESPLDLMVSTNTLPQLDHMMKCKKLQYIDISNVLAEAISYSHRKLCG